MTTGYSTVSSMASLFAEIYEDAYFIVREQTIMPSLVKSFTDGRGDQTRTGSTYPTISASSVAETDDFALPTAWTKTSLATLTPGEIMTQVLLTDRRIETDLQDAKADAAKEMAGACQTKIDTDLIGDMASLTCGTVGTAGSALTWGHLYAAAAILRANKVPKPYYVVLHPYQWFALAKAGSIAATSVPLRSVLTDDIAENWYVSHTSEFDIFTTSDITAGTAAVGGMFNPQALAFDLRRNVRLEPQRDASKRAWELNMTTLYAHGVWRANYGVKVIGDASTPTS